MPVAGVHGAGIMVASEWSIGPDLASGRLVRVLPEWRYYRTSAVHIVMPQGQFVPAKTRTFIDRLMQGFRSDPPWNRCQDS